MTASHAPRPLAPPPIRIRPQPAETTESYARRLARANHLRPSYLRAFLCDPPRRTGAIRPWRLAALSGRAVRALEHALADLAPQPGPPPHPPARQPRAPGSARALISAWLLTEPGLTPMQIWQRLLDEHDTEVCYTTVCHYRSSHTRRSFAFRAGMDDNAGRKSPVVTRSTGKSGTSPLASQTGPPRPEPSSRADLSGTGQCAKRRARSPHQP